MFKMLTVHHGDDTLLHLLQTDKELVLLARWLLSSFYYPVLKS